MSEKQVRERERERERGLSPTGDKMIKIARIHLQLVSSSLLLVVLVVVSQFFTAGHGAAVGNGDAASSAVNCSVAASGPGRGRPCAFPFKFGKPKRSYSTCTDKSDPDGKFWCSTRGVSPHAAHAQAFSHDAVMAEIHIC